MDELAADQLGALAEVVEALDGAGIDYWVFGGWGVDLHAGAVTRSHDDVDIAVWLEDVPRVAQALEARGWRHAPSAEDDGGTGYERGRVRLELTYLVRDADGSAFTPLRRGPATWPSDAFADDVGELVGVRARVVGLAPLADAKASTRDDPEDAAKDRLDSSVLAELQRRQAGG